MITTSTRDVKSRTLLNEPIFILGCNRSGTTVLFQTLSSHPDLWSRYIENRDRFLEVFPDEGREGALVREATEQQQRRVERFLYDEAKNRELAIGLPIVEHLPDRLFQKSVTDLFKQPPLRIVDKTPSNCFRVPMLAEVFARAKFVLIVRRGEAVVSSLMEGWKNWTGRNEKWRFSGWHYLRPPGWKEYTTRPLEEICAFQFGSAVSHAVEALQELPAERYVVVRHEDLITDPAREYDRLRIELQLSSSSHWEDIVERIEERVWTRGGSAPAAGKWRRLHGDEVNRVRSSLEPINQLFYDGDEHLDRS